MKKLIAALAICVGTVAFAEDKPQKVQEAQQSQNEKKRDASQVFTQKPGDSIKEAQRDADKGIDATEVGPKIGKTARDVTGVQTEDEGTFKVAQSFQMRGTLKDKNLEGVSIERKGLPAADLDVREKTAVWLDGKKVTLNELPEGAQVRARFQLEGQDIVAVELRATSPKGASAKNKTPAAKPTTNDTMKNDATGGAGTMKDDANQMKNEVKDDANQAADDMNKTLK